MSRGIPAARVEIEGTVYVRADERIGEMLGLKPAALHFWLRRWKDAATQSSEVPFVRQFKGTTYYVAESAVLKLSQRLADDRKTSKAAMRKSMSDAAKDRWEQRADDGCIEIEGHRYLGVYTASRRLGVSFRAIRRWAEAGQTSFGFHLEVISQPIKTKTRLLVAEHSVRMLEDVLKNRQPGSRGPIRLESCNRCLHEPDFRLTRL